MSDKIAQLLSESEKLQKELGIEPRKMGFAKDESFFKEWVENDRDYDIV